MVKERRRAIHCELVEPSKTSPGYFKYQITIRELDGSVEIVPAYGKDMQDAIERLLWNERVESVAEKKATIPILVGLGLGIIVLSGILSVEHNNPMWIVGALSAVIISALTVSRIESYLNK